MVQMNRSKAKNNRFVYIGGETEVETKRRQLFVLCPTDGTKCCDISSGIRVLESLIRIGDMGMMLSPYSRLDT